ncbi:DNA glycosylase [Aspergillus californicus]
MALRRSTRLNTILPLQQPPSIQQPRNGITKPKPRKPSAKGKEKKNQAIKALGSSLRDLGTGTGTGTEPPSGTPTTNYWESTASKRPQTPPLQPIDYTRPVEPHRTTATLLTPHGSTLVSHPPGAENISPSKSGRPRPTATTGTILDQATAHLIATDKRLAPLIKAHRCELFSPQGLAEKIDPFRSLVGTIIGQQVSGAAARSIRDRFVALVNRLGQADGAAREGETAKDYFPTPEEILRVDIPTLRTAGLSQRKAEYITGLAEKFAGGELSAQMLLDASDEDLLEKLTAVRGLGRWSVEMFACFTLKRLDVFSTGDLGVQRGCAVFLGKDVSKLKAKGGGKFKYMSEKDMLELAAKFAPYRTLFMWYMWRVEDVDTTVMAG